MRLAMIMAEGRPVPAVGAEKGGFVDIAASGLGYSCLEEVIEAGDTGLRECANVARVGEAVERPELALPLTRPGKIMCIGRNYADHCRELGSPLPERPVLFAKYANSLAAPGETVALPSVSVKIDYEAELAAVIGTRCRAVSPEEALDYVFGYTCANDLTMRDAQKADGQWVRAKSPDGFCPVGPWLVTADEVGDPQVLDIRLRLNGRVMQESNTREMVFGVAELVSYLSQTMTLLPGDLLLTGTPPGVGAGRDPQVFLSSGDRLEVEIEKIGTLENRMA